MNSQLKNTYSKGDFVLRNQFVLKISDKKIKSESKIYILKYFIMLIYFFDVNDKKVIKFDIIYTKLFHGRFKVIFPNQCKQKCVHG